MKKTIFTLLMISYAINFAFAETDSNIMLIAAQMALAESTSEKAGYTRSNHKREFDKLNSGETDSFSVNLRQGYQYKIMGVCDKDCKDLDFKLFDDNGNQVSSDSSADSMPIVDVAPKWSATFKLQVNMYSCTRNPCFYGLTVMRKRN